MVACEQMYQKEAALSQATLSATTLAAPIHTFGQLGGKGLITNKALAIPLHLGEPWHSVEYVVLAPSSLEEPTQVGEHVQQSDEMYFLLSGSGCLTTNGEREQVEAGTLVIAPRSTRHSLRNLSLVEPLALLVVELKPPPVEQLCQPTLVKNLFAHLSVSEEWHPATQPLRVVRVDLAKHFSAPWGVLTLVELPPGEEVEEYRVEAADELLFQVNLPRNSATIVAGGYTFQAGIQADMPGADESTAGRASGLSVVIPAGMARRVINCSSDTSDPLLLLSLEVRRQEIVQPGQHAESEGTA
jgi:mannose-6-phosphate isomerase-like protein (cupin superfamily)